MAELDEHDTLPPSMDPAAGDGFVAPPRTLTGILRNLGPGLIIAGSIVGSGELIATTKTGAQAGISLLWLIIVGCLIKVFVQLELGRFAISHGETTLGALDQVPGPRLRANWVLWFWGIMTLATVGQLGGIVGGVGQALALTAPIRGDYVEAIRTPAAAQWTQYAERDEALLSEWDLQLFLPRLELFAASGIGDDSPIYTEEMAKRTGVQLLRLASIDAKLGESVVAQARELEKLGATVGYSEEKEEARTQLRSLLQRANNALLESAEPEQALTAEDASRRKRMLRAHAILSSTLADLDRDEHRASKLMALALPLHAAQSTLEASRQELDQAKKDDADESTINRLKEQTASAQGKTDAALAELNAEIEPYTLDDKFWAGLIAVLTAVVLYRGRYNLIQTISTVLVVTFTAVTIGNVISLQSHPQWHISLDEFLRGLSFGAPPSEGGKNPWLTALATFGIIGVGASELVAYPYWCLEKGYAKFAGPRSDDEGWAIRAKGWIKVMYYDAFASMLVYTLATLAFFIMGVAVLYNDGLDPDGMRMVSTLAEAYVPVFGPYAKWLFLGGAVAVLYSTYLVANAGNARMVTDAIKVFGLADRNNERTHERLVGVLSVILPLLCFAVFLTGANPVTLVLIAGTMQAAMLPIIGFSAIYFRYKLTDKRLLPRRSWDLMLIISCIGLLIAGAWGAFSHLEPYVKMLFDL